MAASTLVPASPDRPALAGSPWARVARAIRREPAALAGFGLVGTYALVAMVVGALPLHDPLQLVRPPRGRARTSRSGPTRSAGTSEPHPLRGPALDGVALVSVALATIAGGALGLLSGYAGGATDLVVGRVMDVFFAFPAILLALGIVAALGPDMRNVVIAIAVVYTPIFARVVRGPVLSLKALAFVEAARSVGATPARIVLRHVLPNLVSIVVVQVSLALSWAVLTEGALSFLGLSAQPPAPSWGVMLNEGRQNLEFATHLALFPGLAIMLAVLGFNLLGDGLRDALDPQQR